MSEVPVVPSHLYMSCKTFQGPDVQGGTAVVSIFFSIIPI